MSTALPGIAAGSPASGASSTRILELQSDPKTLTVAATSSPADLDPQTSNDSNSILALLGMYDTLIALKGEKTDEYVGQLAERWEANDDKSVWTFHLRDGVTFHDGTPCDAEAVRLSFERLSTMGLGLGASWTRFVSDPKQVTAPDPKTVVFDLGKPQPLFEAAVAGIYGVYIVNAKALKAQEKDGDWGHDWVTINEEGIGTGPYRLTQFEPGSVLVMERNDDYWAGWEGNHFDKIVLRVVPEDGTRRQLLEKGEVDLVDSLTVDDLDALKANPDLTLHTGFTAQVDYLYLTEAGPLASPEARQAMNYAFPYDEVVSGVYKGFARRAKGPVAPELKGHDPNALAYPTDLDKAKELFAKAGVAEGTTLEMAISSGSENVKTIAQLLQANLAKIGITLNVTEMEGGSYVSLLYGETPPEERPNLMYWAWWPSYNDGWSQVNDLAGCDAIGANGGGNCGYYCNEELDKLLAECKDATDDATYDKLMAQIQQIVTRDDPPAIYYSQTASTVVTRKEVEGVVINPINVSAYYFYQMGRKA